MGTKPTTNLKDFCNSICDNLKQSIVLTNSHAFRSLLINSINNRTRNTDGLTIHTGASSLYINSFFKYFI